MLGRQSTVPAKSSAVVVMAGEYLQDRQVSTTPTTSWTAAAATIMDEGRVCLGGGGDGDGDDDEGIVLGQDWRTNPPRGVQGPLPLPHNYVSRVTSQLFASESAYRGVSSSSPALVTATTTATSTSCRDGDAATSTNDNDVATTSSHVLARRRRSQSQPYPMARTILAPALQASPTM